MWWNCLTMPWQPGLLTWSMTPTRGWRKDMDASNDASIGRSPIPLALPISMPGKSGRGCAALAWLKRPAQWASRCLQNFAITSRACRGRREPLAQLCVAIGASKMASTGYSTTPFKKMPVACGIRSQPAELCRPATDGAQPPQTGTDGHVWHQSQEAQSGMERRLPSPSPCRFKM